MGSWSPYSEEWEKQHLRKLIEKTQNARLAFEKKPWIYKAIFKSLETLNYYWSLLVIHIRRVFDRKFREEMDQATNSLEERILKIIVDTLDTEKKDKRE